MEPGDIGRIRCGTAVWVWVVRFGRGRWWPGIIESLQVRDSLPMLTIKFECSRHPMKERPVMVGIVSTRMRYVELRSPDLKAMDQPEFTPNSVLYAPEDSGRRTQPSLRNSSISARNGRHIVAGDEESERCPKPENSACSRWRSGEQGPEDNQPSCVRRILLSGTALIKRKNPWVRCSVLRVLTCRNQEFATTNGKATSPYPTTGADPHDACGTPPSIRTSPSADDAITPATHRAPRARSSSPRPHIHRCRA